MAYPDMCYWHSVNDAHGWSDMTMTSTAVEGMIHGPFGSDVPSVHKDWVIDPVCGGAEGIFSLRVISIDSVDYEYVAVHLDGQEIFHMSRGPDDCVSWMEYHPTPEYPYGIDFQQKEPDDPSRPFVNCYYDISVPFQIPPSGRFTLSITSNIDSTVHDESYAFNRVRFTRPDCITIPEQEANEIRAVRCDDPLMAAHRRRLGLPVTPCSTPASSAALKKLTLKGAKSPQKQLRKTVNGVFKMAAKQRGQYWI
jgi:hypothetical protein